MPIERTDPGQETEDLALTFVEEELGRFDWLANWSKAKVMGSALERVSAWLKSIGSDHNPEEIVSFLDNVARERRGRWV